MVKNLLYENIINNLERERLVIENKGLTSKMQELREEFINLNAEYCKNLTQTREELTLNRYDSEEPEINMNASQRRGD